MAVYSTNEFKSGLKILLDGDPYAILENEYVKPGKGQAFNRVRKYVATRAGVPLTWNNSVALHDAGVEVAKLKKGDGPMLLIQGSSQLIQTLLREELIDEFRLLIFPVLLGTGKRLFGEGARTCGRGRGRACDLIDDVVGAGGAGQEQGRAGQEPAYESHDGLPPSSSDGLNDKNNFMKFNH